MGNRGGSGGGNDNDVSGAEAVTFGGTTYSDKKRKGYRPADYNPEKDDTDAKMSLFTTQAITCRTDPVSMTNHVLRFTCPTPAHGSLTVT